MTNETSDRRARWTVLAALALVAAALVASQTYLSMLHHGHSWWRLFLWQSASWSFWVIAGPSLLRRGARSIDRESPRPVASDLAVSAALVLVHTVLQAIVVVALQPFQPVDTLGFFGALRYLSLPWLFVDFLVCALFFAVGHLGATQQRLRELAVREVRLETELARMQLDGLRLKMQPHFLFNTLNSVAALVRRGSNDEALDTVVGLSRLLRRSLESSEAQLVPLREELEFVGDYVALQQRRFADRLRFENVVEDDCLDQQIPSLFLQPLVENAIRHGIAQRPEGGSVRLSAERREQGLLLRVEDDGPGLPEDFDLENHGGVGLGSVAARLDLLYGDGGQLHVRPRLGGGTSVTVLLGALRSELPRAAS
ncbi:MAG: sensor histidine kinase [Acidobacteriota bacterium]